MINSPFLVSSYSSISSAKEGLTALLKTLWNGHIVSRLTGINLRLSGTVAVVCCVSIALFSLYKIRTQKPSTIDKPSEPQPKNKAVYAVISTYSTNHYFELKKILQSIPDLKFHFNDENQSFSFGHYGKEIVTLCNTYPDLSPFFYCSFFKHIFEYDLAIVNAGSKKGFTYDWCPEPKIKELLEKSDSFLQNLEPHRPIVAPSAGEDFVDYLLNTCNFSGFIVGERHSDSSPKKFLIDNIEKLKESGVKTLFLEHLFYETMQPLLDSDGMPPILDAYLKHLDHGFHLDKQHGFHRLVTITKAAGIRVVAIDSRDAYASNMNTIGIDDTRSAERYKTMNYVAHSIIEKEKRDGKYVCLVGSAHSTTCEGVPGLSEILGCPNILVEDADLNATEWNIENYLNALSHVDLLIRQPSTQPQQIIHFIPFRQILETPHPSKMTLDNKRLIELSPDE